MIYSYYNNKIPNNFFGTLRYFVKRDDYRETVLSYFYLALCQLVGLGKGQCVFSVSNVPKQCP